ncbi:hypothetical protein Vretimale_14647 [Volvox reticuliferus]|uniref:Uncharacterized protein n=1 Tax=Volvox reticuliferus TaxID=1737510 RepID=A0A8J4GMJ8_9CHLO|nr:hypothetical protein Vretimale_14647 [Volvox reticuliferus]
MSTTLGEETDRGSAAPPVPTPLAPAGSPPDILQPPPPAHPTCQSALMCSNAPDARVKRQQGGAAARGKRDVTPTPTRGSVSWDGGGYGGCSYYGYGGGFPEFTSVPKSCPRAPHHLLLPVPFRPPAHTVHAVQLRQRHRQHLCLQ